MTELINDDTIDPKKMWVVLLIFPLRLSFRNVIIFGMWLDCQWILWESFEEYLYFMNKEPFWALVVYLGMILAHILLIPLILIQISFAYHKISNSLKNLIIAWIVIRTANIVWDISSGYNAYKCTWNAACESKYSLYIFLVCIIFGVLLLPMSCFVAKALKELQLQEKSDDNQLDVKLSIDRQTSKDSVELTNGQTTPKFESYQSNPETDQEKSVADINYISNVSDFTHAYDKKNNFDVIKSQRDKHKSDTTLKTVDLLVEDAEYDDEGRMVITDMSITYMTVTANQTAPTADIFIPVGEDDSSTIMSSEINSYATLESHITK